MVNFLQDMVKFSKYRYAILFATFYYALWYFYL